jgi:hypothetical protein
MHLSRLMAGFGISRRTCTEDCKRSTAYSIRESAAAFLIGALRRAGPVVFADEGLEEEDDPAAEVLDGKTADREERGRAGPWRRVGSRMPCHAGRHPLQ